MSIINYFLYFQKSISWIAIFIPLAIHSLKSIIYLSISFGVSIKSSSSLMSISSILFSISKDLNKSWPIFLTSTTVGTPIAITGTPIVLLDISFLLFLTPLPGEIPPVDSWILPPTLDKLLDANASITIKH